MPRAADMILPCRVMDVSRSPSATIVVVGDETTTRTVQRLLADESTLVVRRAWPSNCRDGAVHWERPDVVVLDDGSVRDPGCRIRYLRRRWPTLLIAVMNVRDPAEMAALLDAGADDAIVRDSPLLAPRLHALARHARTVNAGARIAVGDIVFDREARRVWCAGHEVQMTPRELSMLDCMFWNAPRPVGTTTLSEFVWGNEEARGRRDVVEVYIGYLRRKLASSRSVVIHTVRGVGYRFDARR